jgi:hypothetical protein
MAIVNFVFTKIHAERSSGIEGKISIKNNVSIKDVAKTDLDLGSKKQPVLKFSFEFTSDYDPKIGLIKIEGQLTYMSDEKQITDVLKEWKKERKIEKQLMTTLLNNILGKCNIEALIISRDINLPPPIPLPKLQPDVKV